jgi:hypothetical protein
MSINKDMKQIKILGNFYRAEPKDIGIFEKEWIENLSMEIHVQSPFEKNLVVNCTWFFDEQYNDVMDWLKYNGNPNNTKIWLCGSVDSLNWIKDCHSKQFYSDLIGQGYNISLVGFTDEHWHSWFPYWLHKHNNNLNVPLSISPKYLYLSYNRKPRDHRKELVEKLIQNNLHEKGHITFEKGYFPVIDDKVTNDDWIYFTNLMQSQSENYKSKPDDRFSRPEDLTSIGDLKIWNNTYMVVVNESEIHDPYHITEKTWKPIIGQRPFVLNSNTTVVEVLKKLKFYVPSDLFEDKSLDDCSPDSIINLLQKLYTLSPEELLSLYKKQYQMIEHNKNRFTEIATGNRKKILHWAQI